MPAKLLRLAACGLFFGAVLTGTAEAAPDAQKIADALVAAMNATGEAEVTYDSATNNGDDVVLTGFSVVDTDGNTAAIPQLVISGAAEREDGGFTAAEIAFDNGSATSDGDTITWQTGAMQDAVVPSVEEVKARAKMRPFTQLDVGSINITGPDMAAAVDIATVSMSVGDVIDGALSDLVLKTNGIHIPSELVTDPQQKALIQALGYDEFLVDLTVDGAFDSVADVLTLRTITLHAADVGTLTMTGKFSGISVGGMAASDEEKAADAKSNARLDTMTIRFDNGGVVERGLDMQAEMIGGTREDVVAQMSGALPFLLNVIGNQKFQEKLAVAGAAFLATPQSLTIVMSPAEPVPLEDITDAIGDNPGTLPDLLVIEVEANEAAN